MSVPVGVIVEYEGMECSPAHTPGAEVSVQNSALVVICAEWERTVRHMYML